MKNIKNDNMKSPILLPKTATDEHLLGREIHLTFGGGSEYYIGELSDIRREQDTRFNSFRNKGVK